MMRPRGREVKWLIQGHVWPGLSQDNRPPVCCACPPGHTATHTNHPQGLRKMTPRSYWSNLKKTGPAQDGSTEYQWSGGKGLGPERRLWESVITNIYYVPKPTLWGLEISCYSSQSLEGGWHSAARICTLKLYPSKVTSFFLKALISSCSGTSFPLSREENQTSS